MGRREGDRSLEAAARYLREVLGRPLDDESARDPWTVGWALLGEVARNGDPFEGEAPDHFIQVLADPVSKMADEVLRTGCFLIDRMTLVTEALTTALLLASKKRRRSLLENWMFAVTCDAAHRLRHDLAAALASPEAPPRARPFLQAVAHEVNLLEYPQRAVVWRMIVDGKSAEQVAREEGMCLEEVEQLVASVLMRADRSVNDPRRRRPPRDEESGESDSEGTENG